MDVVIRKPRQDRSRRSLESVLRAGTAVLAEKGYDGFSIADVSRRSGVSIGSIYQRFESKAGLFAALRESILEEIDREQAALFEGLATGDDKAVIDLAVRRVAETFRRHEALLRVMILRGAVDAETRQRGSLSSVALAQGFCRFLLGSIRTFAHEDPELACDVAFRIVYAALTRRIMSGPAFESRQELSWERFVAELVRACRAYLLGNDGSGTDRENSK